MFGGLDVYLFWWSSLFAGSTESSILIPSRLCSATCFLEQAEAPLSRQFIAMNRGARGARAQAIAAAEKNRTLVSSGDAPSKLDKTGLYDLQQVKRLLDDQVIAVRGLRTPFTTNPHVELCNMGNLSSIARILTLMHMHVFSPRLMLLKFLEHEGFKESVALSNLKIVAGIIAIVAAVYSHFNKREFPENRNLVIACVATYAVCVSLVSILCWVVEGESFFAGRRSTRLESEDRKLAAVWAWSVLSVKGNSDFTLTFRASVRKRANKSVELKRPYEKYFFEDGELDVPGFWKDLDQLLSELTKGMQKSKAA